MLTCVVAAGLTSLFAFAEETAAVDAFAKADAVILLDEMRVEVDSAGTGEFSIDRKIKIQNAAGAFAHRVVVYDYDPLTAFAKFSFARVISKDGTVREIDCGNACDYPAPSRGIYWGARQIMLGIGHLDVGDVLEYGIAKKGFTYALLDGDNAAPIAGGGNNASSGNSGDNDKFVPPMRGEFYDIVPFWSDKYPVEKKVYALAIVKPVQFKFYNGDVKPSASLRPDGKTEYEFVVEHIEPFAKEANMVALSDAAPKLILTTTPEWQEKSRWFCRVNEEYDSFAATPEAQKKVDELVAGAKNDWEKISRLTHWVADNMRYSGISMGKGEGYTLHSTAVNFTDRCGVCKDKAALLISMLRMAGFEAFPAMTMAGSRIEAMPADWFNHCITLVKIDGKWTPLDPTWVPFVRELWSSAEQQQNYLPGLPEGSELRETPLSPAENHYLKIGVTGELSEDGTLRAEYEIEAEGQTDARLRRAYAEGYVADWQKKIEQEIYAIAPDAQIESVELGNDLRAYLDAPFKMKIRFTAPNYAAVSGDGAIVYEPVVFKNAFPQGRRFETIDTKLEKRKYGFVDSCSRTAEFSEKIKLPFDAAEVKKSESSDGEIAEFSGTLDVRGNELSFEQKLVMNKRVYDAGDWEEVRKALLGYGKFAKTPVVILKK